QSLWLGVAVAVHEVAFELVQVRVTDSPTWIELDEAERVTVRLDKEVAAELSLPHPLSRQRQRPHRSPKRTTDFFMAHPKGTAVPPKPVLLTHAQSRAESGHCRSKT